MSLTFERIQGQQLGLTFGEPPRRILAEPGLPDVGYFVGKKQPHFLHVLPIYYEGVRSTGLGHDLESLGPAVETQPGCLLICDHDHDLPRAGRLAIDDRTVAA